jgi:hypothetical protein
MCCESCHAGSKTITRQHAPNLNRELAASLY